MNIPLLLFIIYSISDNFIEPKFEVQVLDDSIEIGYGLAIGDVDGDQKPDILLADKKQFVWYRNGNWKRFVMVENLTESDNVCIAARDIDGDGKVEVAVGAQWNPGETSDTLKSGSVHYLVRPKDPTLKWIPIELHHEPTIHRMRWVKVSENKFQLIVLPLHGRGNKGGEGQGVNVIAYEAPKNLTQKWKYTSIDNSMHLTHNLDIVENGKGEQIYIGGKEGVKIFSHENGKWVNTNWAVEGKSFGEVRVAKDKQLIAGVEPMHGTELTIYPQSNNQSPTYTEPRSVLAADLNQGHALAIDDVLASGNNQVVVGWREPNAEKKVGIKMFVNSSGTWNSFWIDENGMACEDLQLADLNGDGKKDIIAAGRSTHNLKIYWNRSR
ncbi:MAG: VCBS repeat-containing protein [Bacteroidia bacterium]|nr:VCBS repeat-containing protein [Bacteroidia bacterium]